MACKCKICGANEVNKEGDICELCAIGQDPYATGMFGGRAMPVKNVSDALEQAPTYVPKRGRKRNVLINGGGAVANTDPYGNDITPKQDQNTSQVQVHASGQALSNITKNIPAPAQAPSTPASNQPITTGIVKNIVADNQKKGFWEKWIKALFCGIAYSMDDASLMFQVFPDYSGTALNSQGNACDQVVVYGQLAAGAICENNSIEIYGRRDHSNVVVARKIKNVASGTWIVPQRVIPVGLVWTITLVALALLASLIIGLGPTGIVWAVVLLLCFTNLPLVFKIFEVIFGLIFSIFKRK